MASDFVCEILIPYSHICSFKCSIEELLFLSFMCSGKINNKPLGCKISEDHVYFFVFENTLIY